MRKILFIALGLVLCMSLTGRADAETAYLTVMANAQVTCVVSGTTIDFNTYTGSSIGIDANFDVQCTAGTPYTISYSEGNNWDGSQRRMFGVDTGAYLNYELLCEPELGLGVEGECGDVTTFGTTSAGTGDGLVQSWAVSAVLPEGQFVPQDFYEDTVVITLSY